jgi:flagellar biogenesis protein FliO
MKRFGFLLITLLSLCSLPGPAGAEPAEEKVEGAGFVSPTVAPLTRLGMAIAGVGAAGWGLTLWSRRRRRANGGENAQIRVLATHGLGPRHQVALLEVGDQRLLVGMGGDSITRLADLTGEPSFGEELAKSVPPQTEDGKRALLDGIGHFEGLDG